MGRIDAPFTVEQQRALRLWQRGARWHPFTCPNDGRSLVPLDRWVCSACDYEQSWAHDFMVEEGVGGELGVVPGLLRGVRQGEPCVEEAGEGGDPSTA